MNPWVGDQRVVVPGDVVVPSVVVVPADMVMPEDVVVPAVVVGRGMLQAAAQTW